MPQTQVIALLRRPAARLAAQVHLRRGAEVRRPGACRAQAARFFLDELLRNGTTTAVGLLLGASANRSTRFFAEAGRRGMRMIAGKVMMDRNAPAALLDTAERGYRREQGADRALARPRPAALRHHAALRRHLDARPSSRRPAPCRASTPAAPPDAPVGERGRDRLRRRSCFPGRGTTRDVYDRFGLLRPALAVRPLHPPGRARARGAVGERAGRRRFCPTSNLFLGSRPLRSRGAAGDAAGRCASALATDIGGGTSYSMLRHRRRSLQGAAAPRPEAAGARGLLHDDARQRPGTRPGGRDRQRSHPGIEADFVVLDARATPAMAQRMATVRRSRRGAVRADDDGRRPRGRRHLCDGRAGSASLSPKASISPRENSARASHRSDRARRSAGYGSPAAPWSGTPRRAR